MNLFILFKKLLALTLLLIVCMKPEIAFSQGGDNATAAAAAPVTLPFSSTGTTCGHVDNYNPLSPYGITPDGKDWLYYFCAPTSGIIDILMTTAYGTPPAIMVYNTVPNATGSNWTSTSFTGANYINSVLSITATAGSCYYVMIDNYPTATFTETCINYSLAIQYHVNPPAAPLQPACSNIGYDAGNLSGWIGTTGAVNIGGTGALTPSYTPMYYGTTAQQHSVTSGAGVDPYGGFPVVNPAGGSNSLRLGDFGAFGATGQFTGGVPGACGATLEQKFTVTVSNALFVYYYAVVIQDAGTDHTNQEQPFFKTDIFDCSNNPVACGQYLVTGGPGIPGFTLAGMGSNVYYKNWSPVAVDLTPYIGTCVTVRYTVGDCTRGAHFAYAYIDANCSPLAITGINQICPAKSTTLTAPVGLFTYSWTPGGQSTQSVVVSPTVTTSYTCELTSYTNCKTFLSYSVSLFPSANISASSQTICNGTSATLTSTVNTPGGIYAWAPGGGSGASDLVSPAATTNYTCTYTDPNGCQDTALGKVTVNPLPNMVTPANVVVCHNASISPSAFTSTVAGTTYSWTNSNTSIGLGATGTGDTPGFTGINTSASPVTAVISVTPSANFCVGPPVTYSITVNPIPNINAVASGTYCSGTLVPATIFSGSVTSTTYSWINSNPAIGMASTGTGNTPSFNSANSGVSAVSGVITITPSANSCVGVPTNYTVLVNPIPLVTAVPNATYCSGALVPATTFTGNMTTATYSWANSNPAIGTAVSGSAAVPSFNATNNSASGISGVITVTPSANSCVGSPINYTVFVNPIPVVNAVTSATYCSGFSVPSTAFTGSVTGTTYSWTNTNSVIGLAASGTGNAPAFTAANSGSSGISGVITVTPSANSCVGVPANYTVLVNPLPTVDAVPGATYCSGALVPVTTFTGNVTGATYNWTNSNPVIGTASSGSAAVPAFNATNATASGTSGVITVTPSANSCIGTPTDFTIVVNPVPVVNAVPNATYCNGVTVPAVTFTGNVAGATYNWTNSNTAIGAVGSGSSTVPLYDAANTTLAEISGVITVTPSANSCIGAPLTYTVFVNPAPTVLVPPDAVYCAGIMVPASTFTSNLATTVFDWTNSASSIGIGASGIGNIPSFTSVNNTASPVAAVISVTPSANSCVGTPLVFTITVNPNPVAPTVANATICPGSSATLTATAPAPTYKWYDAAVSGNLLATNATYTTPGLTISTTYYVNTTNAFGCISPVTPVGVTVLNFLPVTASANQTICAGQTALLTVAPNGAGFTNSWDSPANTGFSSATSLTVSPAATTNYSVTVTSSNGCSGIGQTLVTVNQLPIANPGTPIAFCQNQSGSVGAASVAGYSYSWTPASGLSSASVSNPLVTLSNTGSTAVTTDYTLTLSLNGCTASNTTAVTVNPLPVSEAGNSMTLCAVQTGTIGTVTTAGYTYSWSPATNLSSVSAADPTVAGVNNSLIPLTISYSVITTEAATSCSSVDHVNVTILPLPNVNAGSVAASCEGTTGLPLNGIAGGSVSSVIWSGGAGSFNPNNTTALATYDPAPAEYANGSVTLTLTALAIAPCQNVSSPVVIDFYRKPVIAYTVDVPKGCPEHCVNFTDHSTVASPDFIQSWTWNYGDGGSGTTQNPAHCYSQTGLYSVTLTATTNHQCTSSLSVPQMIEVYQQPVAAFTPDPSSVGILNPNIAIQDHSQYANTYVWNFGDQYAIGSTNTSTLTNPAHAYTNAGEYVIDLLVTSIHGCTDRASVTVEVLPEFTFYIPNAFTPNNTDGINDLFTGMGIGIEKYEMWVFDRWGERIYYTDDISKGWDGRKQGKSDVVQQDVYIWKVKLKDVFEKNHEYIGHVTLLK